MTGSGQSKEHYKPGEVVFLNQPSITAWNQNSAENSLNLDTSTPLDGETSNLTQKIRKDFDTISDIAKNDNSGAGEQNESLNLFKRRHRQQSQEMLNHLYPTFDPQDSLHERSSHLLLERSGNNDVLNDIYKGIQQSCS